MDKNYVFYYQNVTRSGLVWSGLVWSQQGRSKISTFRVVLLGLAPLSLLTVLNVRVYSAIQSNSNLRQRSYSIILLLIVSVFIICQLPRIVILQSLVLFPPLMRQEGQWHCNIFDNLISLWPDNVNLVVISIFRQTILVLRYFIVCPLTLILIYLWARSTVT